MTIIRNFSAYRHYPIKSLEPDVLDIFAAAAPNGGSTEDPTHRKLIICMNAICR